MEYNIEIMVQGALENFDSLFNYDMSDIYEIRGSLENKLYNIIKDRVYYSKENNIPPSEFDPTEVKNIILDHSVKAYMVKLMKENTNESLQYN